MVYCNCKHHVPVSQEITYPIYYQVGYQQVVCPTCMTAPLTVKEGVKNRYHLAAHDIFEYKDLDEILTRTPDDVHEVLISDEFVNLFNVGTGMTNMNIDIKFETSIQEVPVISEGTSGGEHGTIVEGEDAGGSVPVEPIDPIVKKVLVLSGHMTAYTNQENPTSICGVPLRSNWNYSQYYEHQFDLTEEDFGFSNHIKEQIDLWIEAFVNDLFLNHLAVQISEERAKQIYKPNTCDKEYVCECPSCQEISKIPYTHCIACGTQVGTVYYTNITNNILCVRCAYAQAVQEMLAKGMTITDRPPICASDDELNSWLTKHLNCTSLKKYAYF